MNNTATVNERSGYIIIVPTVLQLRTICESRTFNSSSNDWIRNDYLLFCKKTLEQSIVLLGYGIIGRIDLWIQMDRNILPYDQRHRYSDTVKIKYYKVLDFPIGINHLLEEMKILKIRHKTKIDDACLDNILDAAEDIPGKVWIEPKYNEEKNAAQKQMEMAKKNAAEANSN